MLLAQNDTFGTDPATTAPINTQFSGSTLLALSMGWLRNFSQPEDNKGNTWTQLSGPNIYYSPDFYTALWASPSANGRTGHTLTFQKDDYPAGEISMALIEVKNGGLVDQIYDLAPSSNQSPGSITVDGPATLIAVWGGDSGALDHTAVPDNGFTVIDSYLDFGNNFETAVQVAIASKEVTAAGTYTVKWTSSPAQNCACYLIAVRNSSIPADTTPPTVAITAPAASSIVSGIVNVTASATDNIAVSGVTLYVDGAAEGAEDTLAPYAFSWNTFALPNGTHALTAVARDASGNSATSTAVSVTVNNPAADPNLIVNPSVETASSNPALPLSWFKGGSGTNTRTLTYPVAGFDGAKAIKTEITSYANGNAKWYFSDVPVTPGKAYSFSDHYQSNVPSSVNARFKMTNGTFTYGNSTVNPASPGSWSQAQRTITVPANVTSMTVFHSIAQVGSLTTDDFSLTEVTSNLIVNPSVETASSNPALPLSWFKGGSGTNTRTLTYPVAGFDGAKAIKTEITSYANGNAKWYFEDVPVTPGKTYAFSDYYQSNVPNTVNARFKLSNGTFIYGNSIVNAASPSSWSHAQRTITVPANVTSMTVFHSIAQVGTLTTDNFSLTLP